MTRRAPYAAPLTLWALLAALSAPAASRAGTPADLHEQARAAYELARERRQQGDSAAAALFAHAGVLLDAILERDDGVVLDRHATRLAAFAFLEAKSPGFAALYVRRALFLNPLDADLRRAESDARAAGWYDAPQHDPGLTVLVASYVEFIPRPVRLAGMALGAGVLLLLAAWRAAMLRPCPPRWSLAVAGAGVALFAALLAPTEYLLLTNRDAVVIEPTPLRAEPSFVPSSQLRADPLKPGGAVTVRQRRTDWVFVTTARSTSKDEAQDGGWIPAANLREVFGTR